MADMNATAQANAQFVAETLALLEGIRSRLEPIKDEQEHKNIINALIGSVKQLESDPRLQRPDIMKKVTKIMDDAREIIPLLKSHRLNRIKAILSLHLSLPWRKYYEIFYSLESRQEDLTMKINEQYPILCDPSTPISVSPSLTKNARRRDGNRVQPLYDQC